MDLTGQAPDPAGRAGPAMVQEGGGVMPKPKSKYQITQCIRRKCKTEDTAASPRPESVLKEASWRMEKRMRPGSGQKGRNNHQDKNTDIAVLFQEGVAARTVDWNRREQDHGISSD